MKVTLYLLVILSTAFGFPQEDQRHRSFVEFQRTPEIEACEAKCTDEEKKIHYICTDGGPFAYRNSCTFKCNPYGHKEIKCAPDSWPACKNKCTPEERRDDRGNFCDEKNDTYFAECDAKCGDSNYSNNKITPC